MNPDPLHRRWCQYKIRTLLLGVTLLAIPCGYVGWCVKIARDRAATVAREAKLGWLFVLDPMPPLFSSPTVILPVGAAPEDVARARREFPDMRIDIDHERWCPFGSKPPKTHLEPPPDSDITPLAK